jgi:hypothetical protein
MVHANQMLQFEGFLVGIIFGLFQTSTKWLTYFQLHPVLFTRRTFHFLALNTLIVWVACVVCVCVMWFLKDIVFRRCTLLAWTEHQFSCDTFFVDNKGHQE